MTDIFRSDILAVVMNQLVDEPVLPTLFLRTVSVDSSGYYMLVSDYLFVIQVIQAVTTYRTLVGFVSSTLLTRLIIKKVWTVPPLWEGFMRCAKLIAPAAAVARADKTLVFDGVWGRDPPDTKYGFEEDVRACISCA